MGLDDLDTFDNGISIAVTDAVAGVEFLDDLAETRVGQWVREEEEGSEQAEDRRPQTDQAPEIVSKALSLC